jgi:hypothetical protein
MVNEQASRPLKRAPAFGAGGCRFDSCRGAHLLKEDHELEMYYRKNHSHGDWQYHLFTFPILDSPLVSTPYEVGS